MRRNSLIHLTTGIAISVLGTSALAGDFGQAIACYNALIGPGPHYAMGEPNRTAAEGNEFTTPFQMSMEPVPGIAVIPDPTKVGHYFIFDAHRAYDVQLSEIMNNQGDSAPNGFAITIPGGPTLYANYDGQFKLKLQGKAGKQPGTYLFLHNTRLDLPNYKQNYQPITASAGVGESQASTVFDARLQQDLEGLQVKDQGVQEMAHANYDQNPALLQNALAEDRQQTRDTLNQCAKVHLFDTLPEKQGSGDIAQTMIDQNLFPAIGSASTVKANPGSVPQPTSPAVNANQ